MSDRDDQICRLLAEEYGFHAQRMDALGERNEQKDGTLLVHTDRGPVIVKAVENAEPDERTGDPRQWFEDWLRVQDYLANKGIPAPAPIRTKSGHLCIAREGYICAVLPYVEGQPFDATPEKLRSLGRIVGWLHSVPIPDTLRGVAARQEPSVHLPIIRKVVERAVEDLPQDYRWVADEARRQLAELPSFEDLPRSLIHTDLAWSNLLQDAAGQLWLVDFEGAGVGPLVVDLVEVTTYLTDVEGGVAKLDTEGARSFYEGYTSARRLAAQELDAFPAAHRYHQLWCLAWHLWDRQYPDAARKLSRIAAWEESGTYAALQAFAGR